MGEWQAASLENWCPGRKTGLGVQVPLLPPRTPKVAARRRTKMEASHNYEQLKRSPAGEPREQLAVGVAQLAEQAALNRKVVGSTPTARTIIGTTVLRESFTGASVKRWQT